MRDYGKVAPTFWTRGSGKALRGDPQAQVLALFLFTAPAASPTGLYYLALPTVCHETGLAVGAVRASMKRLESLGIAFYDEGDGLVWVPEMARYQLGAALSEKDKRGRWVEKELGPHRGHRFHRAFLARYGAAYHLAADVPSEDHSDEEEAPTEALPDQSEAPHIYDIAPAPVPASAPEGGAGGAGMEPVPPGLPQGVRLGDPGAVRRRPVGEANDCDNAEARTVLDSLREHKNLAGIARPALANRIAAGAAEAHKPLHEVIESIRAASNTAANQAAGGRPMPESELINLVCGYATKRRVARAGPSRGGPTLQAPSATPQWEPDPDAPT